MIDQVRVIQHGAPALGGTGLYRLESRDIEVSKVLADGMGTGEVAVRFKVRNRTHAVAFALRVGLF